MLFVKRKFLFSWLCLLGWLTGCTKSCTDKQEQPASSPKPATEDLATRGQKVYTNNCIACHNIDPKKDGSPGPAIHGSSMDLLEARVLHGTYPPGYKPKKATQLMVKLPYLHGDIAALHAFLNK